MITHSLLACHECDLLNRETPIPYGAKAYCRRCGAVLCRRTRDSLDRTLAFTLGAAILMIVANLFQIVELDVQGHHTSTTLFGSVRTLYNDGMWSVAALVFATTMLMPVLNIGAMLYMLVPLKFGWISRQLPAMFRLFQAVRPWGMVEVFMLGTLVSLAKLGHLAHVVPGIALWSFAMLMVLVAAAAASFDADELWARVDAIRRRGV
ncbi:paraquat-inducible protein A [Nitrospira sp. Nam74]